MKIIFKKTMLEKIMELIDEAHLKAKSKDSIDYLEVSEDEAVAIYDELEINNLYPFKICWVFSRKEKIDKMKNSFIFGIKIKVV